MTRLRGRIVSIALAASVACSAAIDVGRARAFSEPASYFDEPKNGGGGGRWFTGSPAEGYDCSVCHTGQTAQSLYVDGLPDQGYVAGNSYDVRLYWPDVAARAQALRQMGGEPSMGLVAEFVAENGKASGTVEIATDKALPTELCQVPMGLRAAQLYSVRPAKDTAEATTCNANSLGQRCLITVVSCGAQELHVHWTPPPEWQGPIWFTAGLVATDKISGNPQGDSISEVTRVLMPATSDGARYVNTLHGQCSVTAADGTSLPSALIATCVGAVLARRRKMERAT